MKSCFFQKKAVNSFTIFLILLNTLSVVVAAGYAQAIEPFAGTWNWNAKASRLTDQRLTIKVSGENTYTFDDHYGTPNTVLSDGKPQKMSNGDTLALMQTDASTWKTTYTGTISGSGTYKVSADGQRLTKQQTIVWADGGTEDRRTDLRRIGSGKGLAGEWEIKSFDSKSSTKPFQLIFTPGNDGYLTASFPAQKIDYIYRLDGKDYEDPTPGVAKGTTMATRRIGTRAIHVDSKLNGAPIGTIDFEISADGRTMTVRHASHDQPKPILYTMDRQ